MTVQQLFLRAISTTWGIRSLDPTVETNALNSRGIVPGDLEDGCSYLNAAFQEILDKGPASLSETKSGGILMSPTNITLNVTAGSATVTAPVTFASWMNECTIRVSGDSWDNRIRVDSGTYSLERPYAGTTTGNTTATVYGDALAIPFKNVIDPVGIPGIPRLHMCAGYDEFIQWPNASERRRFPLSTGQNPDYLPYPYYYDASTSLWQRPVGIPRAVLVETSFRLDSSVVPVFLRVTPMPASKTPISYRAKLKPLVWTTADIDNGDHVTDPGTLIPEEWNESLLLPFVRKRFLEHPLSILSEKQFDAAMQNYADAVKALQGWKPQIGRVQADYI